MKTILSFCLLIVGYGLYQMMTPSFNDSRELFFSDGKKMASATLSGMDVSFTFEPGLSVAEALRQADFTVSGADILFPPHDVQLAPGTNITWQPARSIHIIVDGLEESVSASAATSAEIITEAGIVLDEDDIVVPDQEMTVPDGAKITITRVEIREETKEVKVPFITTVEEDNDLSWRKKIVTQKGENGLKRTTYKVSYHNGKEVNRKTLSTEVTKEPVMEAVTQGTLVKTGKAHRGAASWYAWTGTMAAANPWLPKGSYVKVTNVDNGKSVIVIINDRGPFVPGRIIDLDKVAFEKIASIGAGVINVKMEEIVN